MDRKPLPRACWLCEHYVGLLCGGSYAECSRPGCCRVRQAPETGCSAFSRMPGLDLPDTWAPVEWIEHEKALDEVKRKLDEVYYARGREALQKMQEQPRDRYW